MDAVDLNGLIVPVCVVPMGRPNCESPTDRESLLALRGVCPESEAGSVRSQWRRVTLPGSEIKHGLFRVVRRAPQPETAAASAGNG